MGNCVGRPQVLTEGQLLNAIGKRQSSEPRELLKYFRKKTKRISRATIYRRLETIPEPVVNAILKQAKDNELKPLQRNFKAFCKIPEVREWSENLKFIREVSPQYQYNVMCYFFKICKLMKRHPSTIVTKESVKDVAEFIKKIVKSEVIVNLYSAKRAVRSWYENHGISGEFMTSLGLDGAVPKPKGSRAMVRLSKAY